MKTRTTEVEVQTALKEMKRHVSIRDITQLESEPIEDTEELMSLLEILARVGSFPFKVMKVQGREAGNIKTMISLGVNNCPGCNKKVNYSPESMIAASSKCNSCCGESYFGWIPNIKNWRMV